MGAIRVQELFIYPIKSTQGIRVQEMELTELGPAYDRRWMLVGEKNEFLTQRKFPQLSQLFVEFDEEGLQLFTPSMRRIKVRVPTTKERIAVKIWQDVCQAVPADAEINQWISDLLRIPVTLVYMPELSQREVRESSHSGLSFADTHPFHLITSPSLIDLNDRIANENLLSLCFRPNIVVEGDFPPYDEDQWDLIKIGEAEFCCTEWCSRCQIPTLHPFIGVRQGSEPLHTLEKYRLWKQEIWFGQNMILESGSKIKVGDPVSIMTRAGNSLAELHAQG